MAIHDRTHSHQDLGLTELRAERLTREIARMNKRLGLVLLLVALPYLLFAGAVVVTLAAGGDATFGVN